MTVQLQFLLIHKTKNKMGLKKLQKQVDNWIKQYGVRYFDPLTNMAQLSEEVGEVARIIARRYGEQSEKESDKEKITNCLLQLFDDIDDLKKLFNIVLPKNSLLKTILKLPFLGEQKNCQ